MADVSERNQEDQAALVTEHLRLTDSINESLINFQDMAYELGLARGLAIHPRDRAQEELVETRELLDQQHREDKLAEREKTD